MLAIALILDAIFGEPNWLWQRLTHPAVLMGRAVDWVERIGNQGRYLYLKGIVLSLIHI